MNKATAILLKKIKYIFKHKYNPYPFYWFDLITERHLKNRVGECTDCIDCCKYVSGGKCLFADANSNRCNTYHNRKCNEWFPISQKELQLMQEWKPFLKCKYSFKQSR